MIQTIKVNGVEFSWKRLKKKLGLTFDKYNGTGAQTHTCFVYSKPVSACMLVYVSVC